MFEFLSLFLSLFVYVCVRDHIFQKKSVLKYLPNNSTNVQSVLRINEDKLMLSMMIYVDFMPCLCCVSHGNFFLSTASHVENGHSTNRVLDVTILRTFNAFKIAIYLFLKIYRGHRRRCMTLIRSPSHYYVSSSSSSSSCTRIMPNNKNDPRDHSATVIHILRQFQIAHFRIPHSRPEAHSIRPQNKNDTQTHKRKKTTATKKYSF